MDTFSQIIEAFGGYAQFAGEVGVPRSKAAVWRHRDSIPPAHWLAVVEAAGRLGISVSLETMAAIAAGRVAKDDPSNPRPGEAA